MTRTYWIDYPRDFANEFTVAVATNSEMAKHFQELGYERITRDKALRRLSYRGDAATQAYVSAEYDKYSADPRELALALRTGESVDPVLYGEAWDENYSQFMQEQYGLG